MSLLSGVILLYMGKSQASVAIKSKKYSIIYKPMARLYNTFCGIFSEV